MHASSDTAQPDAVTQLAIAVACSRAAGVARSRQALWHASSAHGVMHEISSWQPSASAGAGGAAATLPGGAIGADPDPDPGDFEHAAATSANANASPLIPRASQMRCSPSPTSDIQLVAFGGGGQL